MGEVVHFETEHDPLFEEVRAAFVEHQTVDVSPVDPRELHDPELLGDWEYWRAFKSGYQASKKKETLES